MHSEDTCSYYQFGPVVKKEGVRVRFEHTCVESAGTEEPPTPLHY